MQSRVLAILIAVVLALVATAAMVVYVNSVDRRALAGQQPTNVLVAVKPIPLGMKGEDAHNGNYLEWRAVAAKNALPGRVRSEEQLRNRYAAVNIVVGEQLLLDRWVGAEDVGGRRLLQIPEGHQAVSVGVDLVRQVAGFVTPGDRVNVAVTMPVGEESDKTRYVLRNVQVLAVGATALTRSAEQGNGGRVSQGKGSQTLTAVTLAVADRHVMPVIFAAEKGSIYLTLLPPNAATTASGPGGKAADENEIFGVP